MSVYRYKTLPYIPREYPDIPEGTELYAAFYVNIDNVREDIRKGLYEIRTVSVNDIQNVTKDIPLSDCQNLDFSMPIVFGEVSPDEYVLIDGNHRVTLAIANGIEQLQAVVLSAEQFVDYIASEKIGRGFVEHWNEKAMRYDGYGSFPKLPLNGRIEPHERREFDATHAWEELCRVLDDCKMVEVQGARGWFSVARQDDGSICLNASRMMAPSIKCSRACRLTSLSGSRYKPELEALIRTFV